MSNIINDFDVSLNVDYKKVKCEEKSDEAYQLTLLKFFKLKEFDLEKINKKIEVLFHFLRETIEKDHILFENSKKSAGQLLSEDQELGFMLQFSYSDLDNTIGLLKPILSKI